MRYCARCGAQIDGNVRFCANCGAEVLDNNAFMSNAQPQPQPQKRQINTKMLVLSIVMMFLGSRIFGIVAVILTLLAANETTDEGEKSKLKAAKIFNVVSVIMMCISIVMVVIWTALNIAVASSNLII